MTNREMLSYLREEINENRRIVIYLNVLVAKMVSPEDTVTIRKEMNRLTSYIETCKEEFDKLYEKEVMENYEDLS